MKLGFEKRQIFILALILIASIFFISIINGNSKGETKTSGNLIIKYHDATSSEIEKYKELIGTYSEDEEYNELVNGHGTGLTPPTKEGWDSMEGSMKIIDSIILNSLDSDLSNYDASETNYFPPIGNQDGEGSCVCFAVGYYEKTFQEAKDHNWNLTGATWVGGYKGNPHPDYQDKIMSPDFIYHQILLWNNNNDQGSYYSDAMNLISTIGACSWEEMPYDPDDSWTWPSESAWREASLYRGQSGFNYMPMDTDPEIENLKKFISDDNLAVISINANEYKYTDSNDLWTYDTYTPSGTNHANTIVGFDDNFGPYTEEGESRSGAFKVANSWGTGWNGDHNSDGFYWISYEALKRRIGYVMFMDDRIDYNPQLLSTFEIDHDVRTECRINLGIGTHTSPNATKNFNNWICKGKGDPFPNSKIVLDITEFYGFIPKNNTAQIWMKINDGGNKDSETGTIEQFSGEYYKTYNRSGNYDISSDSSTTPISTINGENIYVDLIFELIWDHDIAVKDVDAQNSVEVNTTIAVNATIKNVGKENETDVEVELLVNGVKIDSTTISSINSSETINISFNWTPAKSGDFNISIYAKQITGEKKINDNWGNISIYVYLNHLPILNSIGTQIAVEDLLYNYDVDANDADEDVLTFSDDTDLFDIDSETGIISFYPTNDDIGEYSVNITVSDKYQKIDYEIVNFIVWNTNDKPILDVIGDQYLNEDELFEHNVKAIDIDASYILRYFDNTTLFDIDSTTGLISFIPNNDDIGMHQVNISVTDGNGGIDWEEIVLNVNNTNDAPIISGVPNQVGFEDKMWTLDLTPYISDVDNNTNELIISEDSENVTVDGKILTFLYENGENFETIKITVSDGLLFNIQTISVSVQNTNDAPILVEISNQYLNEDELFELNVWANDVDIGDILIYSDNTSLFQIDSSTGFISFTPTNDFVGVHFVDITVTDNHGGIDWVTVIFTINNTNDAPNIFGVPNQFGFEDKSWILNLTNYISDVDNNKNELIIAEDSENITVNGLNLIFLYENNENFETVEITVSDGFLFDEQEISVTVQNTNDAPVLDVIDDQYLDEDTLFELEVMANDIDAGDILRYSDDSSIFNIDPITGLVAFTPTNEDVGEYVVNISVSDMFGRIDWKFVTFTVSNTNDPPQITSSPMLKATQGIEYKYQVMANDIDIDDNLNFDLEKAPIGMTINNFSGQIIWTPTNADVGIHEIIVNVTDTKNTADIQIFELEVINSNDQPNLDRNNLDQSNTTATEDKPFILDINATDIDINDMIMFWDDTTLFNIDPGTGLITFIPKDDDVGNHYINISISDGNGGTDKEMLIFTILNANDSPVLEKIGNKILFEDMSFIYDVNAIDIDNDPLTFSSDTILFDINQISGEITFTPENGDVGTHIVNISVSDVFGGYDYEIITLTIRNTNDPPIIEEIDDQILTEDTLYELRVISSDIDNGDKLLFTDDTTLFEIDPKKGIINFTPTNEDVGTYKVNISVSDNNGGADYTNVEFIVKNTNDAPIIENIPNQYGIENISWILNLNPYISDVDNKIDDLIVSTNSDNINVFGTSLKFLYENGEYMGWIMITISDGELYDNQSIFVNVQNTNDNPEILKNDFSSGDFIAIEDTPFIIEISATDIDNDPLRFSTDSSVFGIDPITGIISFTPRNDDVGEHFLNIIANDGNGGVDFWQVIISVQNVNDPPLLNPIGSIIAVEGESFSYIVTAKDNDIGDTLTFSDDSEFFDTNPNTGTISFSQSHNVKAGTYDITITVKDSEGAKDQKSVNILILPKSSTENDYTFPILFLFMFIIFIGIGSLFLSRKQNRPQESYDTRRKVDQNKNLQPTYQKAIILKVNDEIKDESTTIQQYKPM